MTRYQGAGVALLAAAAMAVTGLASPALGSPAHTAPHVRAATAGVISTVAGGVGSPGPATSVAIPGPCGLAFGNGDVYVASNYSGQGGTGTISAVSPSTGRLTTTAGNAAAGEPLGAGGPATSASMHPCGIVTDRSGNLVMVDQGTKEVRVVARSSGTFYGQAMTKGDIYTVAGNGDKGYGNAGVPATSTELNDPVDVAVDSHGNLVITDSGTAEAPRNVGARVQVVAATSGTFYGQAMTAGYIYTVAGSKAGAVFSGLGGTGRTAGLGLFLGDVHVDSAGNLLFTDEDAQQLLVLAAKTGSYYGQAMAVGHLYSVAGDGAPGSSGDGGPATAAELDYPGGITIDHEGNVVIADTGGNRVRVVAESAGPFYGQPMTAGDIYTVAGNGTAGYSGDGGPATSAELNAPATVAVDASGNLLIADTANNRVRVVAGASGTFYGQAMTAGDIYTGGGNGTYGYSGDRGSALLAQLNGASGVAVDSAGDVVISDPQNNRVRVVAASTGTLFGQAMTKGDIYTVAGNGTDNTKDHCTGGLATGRAVPQASVAIDGSGNLLITSNDQVCLVPARSGTFYGQAMTAGHLYALAGDGTRGYSGDGGPASSAELSPGDATVDREGNLVIADTQNDRIRVVAESPGTFYGQAMTAGDIYTVAGNGTPGSIGNGGPATSAEFFFPRSVTVDGAGNLVICDSGNGLIRVVAESSARFYGRAMTAGDIYTVAGDGSGEGYTGDGGPATSASLEDPNSVAVDGAGNLVIADEVNLRVRVVAESPGTFYGVAMTASDIYTVAGDGTYGYTGDGGPGISAAIGSPMGVAVSPAGNLLIADGTNRVRELTG